MPRVSVIIPTYNRKDYVQEAIDSVLAQTYTDYEIIVVDDGSTDGTGEALQARYGDRIRYVWQENRGVSAARNTGVMMSGGRYLLFHDSDDRLLPHNLEALVPALDADSELCFVSSGWLYVDEQGNHLREVEPWKKCLEIDLVGLLTGDCPFVLHSTLFRREAIQAVELFDATLPSTEDWDLLIRLAARQCRMKWVHVTTSEYRMHPGNMTRNPDRRKSSLKVLDKFFDSPEGAAVDAETKGRAYANSLLLVANAQYLEGSFIEAQESIRQAISWLPSLIEGSPPSLVTWIRNWAFDPRVRDPVRHVSIVFDHLPQDVRHLRDYRRPVLADVRINMAFSHYSRQNWSRVPLEIAWGLLTDPSWVKNRGVWSIAIRSSWNRLRSL